MTTIAYIMLSGVSPKTHGCKFVDGEIGLKG